jgi:beta-N-acetylhexosaminidase
MSTAKHFPGHGNTHIDSHLEIPIIKGNKKYLLENELVPFKAAIKAGVQSIMVGHLGVPAIEKNPKITATLSKKIITDLLIKQMGFDGLIMTDAMNMESVCKNFSAAEATVMAFNAGNDLILFPPDEEIAVDALNTALNFGRISKQRIDHSLRKLLSAKRWLKIIDNRFVNLNDIPKSLSTKEHLKLAQAIADKSITLVKDEKSIIPLNKSKYQNIFWITITEGLGNESETFFQSLLQVKFPNSMQALVHQETNDEYYDKILDSAGCVDLVILSSFIKVKAYQGSVSISKKHEELIKKILKLKKPNALISFGNPYLLKVFPKVNAYLCAFGDTNVSQQAMLKALKGEIDIQGRLPISIPNTKYS